jgi:hypothetical protein
MEKSMAHDPVNHPKHYTAHPSGVECIQITEHFDFLIGNVIKYAWRAGLKEGSSREQDLAKCVWYAQRALDQEKSDAPD